MSGRNNGYLFLSWGKSRSDNEKASECHLLLYHYLFMEAGSYRMRMI
jgi:hypothetical protein